jgi:hypothetical protein
VSLEWFLAPEAFGKPISEESVMVRLYSILSNSFGCMAVALLVLGVLSVSPFARADEPCASACPEGYECHDDECVQAGECAGHSDCNNPDNSCYYTGYTIEYPCSNGDCKKVTDPANCGGCKCKKNPGVGQCQCQK